MSTSKIILRNRHGKEVAAISFDEDSHRWRIVSKGEPKFKRDFPTQKEAFDCMAREFPRRDRKAPQIMRATLTRREGQPSAAETVGSNSPGTFCGTL